MARLSHGGPLNHNANVTGMNECIFCQLKERKRSAWVAPSFAWFLQREKLVRRRKEEKGRETKRDNAFCFVPYST